MGYTFHITRARLWTESTQYPISRDEWTEAARRHPEIHLDPDAGGGMLGAESLDGWFTWSAGQVTTWFSEPSTAWMVRFARELEARLVGDDEEEYSEDGSSRQWSDPPAS